MRNLGARVYGLAAAMTGVAGLLWGDFATDWMPVPATLPGRLVLAYLVALLLLAGGALINLSRTAAWGAGLLTVVYALGLILLDLTRLATHATEFAYWSSSAEQLALVVGGALAWVSSAALESQRASRMAFAGRFVFGVCLLFFGAAHFVYADYTAVLVPKWLPPSQTFWACATGVAQIAAGFAMLSGVLALLAARLLTAMYIIFGLFVHTPLVTAAPASHGKWVEFILNLALVGAAWVVADQLAARKPGATF